MKSQSRQESGKSGAGGFTLTELLVTITIIIVIAMLAFSLTTRMRNSAYQVTSMNNMAQLQIANASFASDNSGKYVWWIGVDEGGKGIPGATYWMWNTEFLKNYRGEPIKGREGDCPISMLDGVTTRSKKAGYASLDGSYGYNIVNMPGASKGWFGGNSSGPDKSQRMSFNIGQVTNPSRSACFITATDMRASNHETWWTDPKSRTEGRTNSGTIAYRHSGKALVVFYDGHVAAMSKVDFDRVTPKGEDKRNLSFWNAAYPNLYD